MLAGKQNTSIKESLRIEFVGIGKVCVVGERNKGRRGKKRGEERGERRERLRTASSEETRVGEGEEQ